MNFRVQVVRWTRSGYSSNSPLYQSHHDNLAGISVVLPAADVLAPTSAHNIPSEPESSSFVSFPNSSISSSITTFGSSSRFQRLAAEVQLYMSCVRPDRSSVELVCGCSKMDVMSASVLLLAIAGTMRTDVKMLVLGAATSANPEIRLAAHCSWTPPLRESLAPYRSRSGAGSAELRSADKSM